MRKVEKVKRTCLICGKEFTVYPQALIRRRCDFCSPSCYGKAKTQGLVAVSTGVIYKKCAYCHKQFEVKNTKQGQKRKFCSISCASRNRAKKPTPPSLYIGRRFHRTNKYEHPCQIRMIMFFTSVLTTIDCLINIYLLQKSYRYYPNKQYGTTT